MKHIYYLLGIQSYANHDSGASILKYDIKENITDYVAISEERLLRKKYPYTFPIHSINYCLKYFNLEDLNKVDYIFSDWIRKKRWLRSGPAYNYQMFDYIKEKLNFNKNKIIQIDHHLAHAASVYYTSDFKDSSILIVDGNGSDLETNSFFLGKKNKIKLIDKSKYQGIGALYSAITKEVLNLGTGSEGKTMGLAPYGKRDNKINIKFKLKGINTDFSDFIKRMPYSDVLNHLNGNFRPNPLKQKIRKANKRNLTNKFFSNWAFAIQKLSEKTILHLGNEIYKKNKSKNICLAGGVALNSVANNYLYKKGKFKKMFVFPACSDSGIPLGLVLWGYHNFLNGKKRINFSNAFTGIEYSNKEIISNLKKNNIKFSFTNNNEIAKYISNGKVIGYFQGKSEYGPRALGNRSILADARDPKMRDYINKKVKHREMFRPFAPAILEEKSKKYFDLDYSPFMLQVSRSKKRKKIPSAIHVDGTARVQTVNEKQNKNFYNLIKSFYKITKVPVILNTSFNDAGEPLVETPLDALICFLKTNIDYLVIDNIIIDKKNLKDISHKIKKLELNRNKEIENNEKKIIKKLTKKFSFKEFNAKKNKENLNAKKIVLDEPISRLKNYLNITRKNKKPLIIIGTEDHTNILSKIFKLNKKNTSFIDINKNDHLPYKRNIHKIKRIKNLTVANQNNANILISSFEYINEIIEQYKLKNFFTPYDNSSRSIMDYYYIKKFNKKSKIFSHKLY